jgi:hypothetical protein
MKSTNNFKILQILFRKESHYVLTMGILASVHVLYMTYLFPRSWADTPSALALIDRVASIVPVIENLREHVPPYTNYWGVFYAVFWIMAPIYFALGFVGSFFLSPYRYQKLVVETSMGRVSAMLALFFAGVGFEFALPLLSFGAFMNQMSSFLPKLLSSWFVSAGLLYYLSQTLRVLILKFITNKNK